MSDSKNMWIKSNQNELVKKILFYICEELHNSEARFIPLNIILGISNAILPTRMPYKLISEGYSK